MGTRALVAREGKADSSAALRNGNAKSNCRGNYKDNYKSNRKNNCRGNCKGKGRCYRVRLKSGVAMRSEPTPKSIRKVMSGQMAVKPPSLRRMDLKPWTA